MSKRHWVPKTKYELVRALAEIWPDDRARFKRMRKKQLYAIWFKYWRKKLNE